MKNIFLIILFILTSLNCFTQAINVQPHTKRIISQIPSVKNHTRKIADIHLTKDRIGNVYIGGNRYKHSNSGFTKLKSYDLDIYNNNLELIKSNVLVYNPFNFIKNMDLSTNQGYGEVGNSIIIGGAMKDNNNQNRGTVLTNVDNVSNTMHYKYITFNFNGQTLRTGGVTLKPIVYGGTNMDDQMASNYYIGVAKDFDNNKGSGAIIFIFDKDLNIIQKKYFNINNGNDVELTFNDIVQIGTPRDELPNDPSILDALSQNNVIFAVQGSTSNRNHSLSDAFNLNSFKEVLTIVDPQLNVLSSYQNSFNGTCKGADLYYDEATRSLYTLGHFRLQNYFLSSYYIAKYKLDLQQNLQYVSSLGYLSKVSTPNLFNATQINLFQPQSSYQQANATCIEKVDNSLVVSGNIEGYITIPAPPNSNQPAVDLDFLSHFSFIQKIDMNLNSTNIQVNAFNKFKSNLVYLKDFNFYNSPSSRTLSSEFTPKTIVNTANGLKSVFNSDFSPSEIKFNAYRAIDPRIEGCDIHGISIDPFGIEFPLQFEDNLIQSNDIEFQEEAHYDVIDEENTSIYKCSQPFGVAVNNGCNTPKNLRFSANATFNKQVVSGATCENIGKISISNLEGATTGYIELIFKNLLNGYIVSINPAFANDYYLHNVGNNTFRIYRYDNSIPLGNLTDLIFVRRMRPTSMQANAQVASIDVNFVFHNTRSNNINIPIHRNFLYSNATFSCNATPQVACTNVINPITNIQVSGINPNCNTVNICFDFENHTGNTQMRVEDFKFKLSHLFGDVDLSNPQIVTTITNPSNGAIASSFLAMNATLPKIRVCLQNVPVDLRYNNALVLDYTYQKIGSAFTNTPYCQRMQFSKSLINVSSGCCAPDAVDDVCTTGNLIGNEDLFKCDPVPINPAVVASITPTTPTTPGSPTQGNTSVKAADATHNQHGANDGAGDYSDTETKSTKPIVSNQNAKTNIQNQIIPNPNNGSFKLILEDAIALSSEQILSIEVRNISGQILQKLQITYERLQQGIELNTLSNGVYYLKVSKDDIFLGNAKLQIQR